MVKLKAPMLGLSASGRLGRVLAFSTTRRDTVAGRRRIPSQPRTEPQRATRHFMAIVALAWSDIPAGRKATWSTLGDEHNLSPYHAYLKFNANTYKHLHATGTPLNTLDYWPTEIYPPTRALSPCYHSLNQTKLAPGRVTFTFTVLDVRFNWLYLWHRVDLTNDPVTYTNLVAATIVRANQQYVQSITNLPPGLQYIKLIRVSTDGRTHTGLSNHTITVPS